MNEIIVIFRRDGREGASPSFPNCLPTTRASSARHTNMSLSIVPPITIFAFPKATLPLPPNTETCSRSWRVGDTT